MQFKMTVFVLLMLIASSVQADWMRFRGPNGSGVSDEKQAMPVKWSDQKNLKWKAALPGRGSSSPIIVGDKVFITCWSGYGMNRSDPGDQKNLRRHLVCLDRKSGKILWDKSVKPVLPEDTYTGMFAEHGYASHTPTSDGKHVYVYFGKSGALAYDFDGNQLWQTIVGDELDPRRWGSSSSPILYKNLLIVTATAESEAIVALNKETGKEVWRQESTGFNATWGTPILVSINDERTDLVIGVPFEIWSLNPNTGKLRWYCEAMSTETYCSSVIAHHGVVYGIEGRGGGSIAVRANGKGDVTKSHVLWSGRDSNRIETPLIYQNRIYFFSKGIANCIDAKTGERIFRGRLDSENAAASDQREEQAGNRAGGRQGRGGFRGSDYSSPVIADGKIYFTSRSGETYVIKASDKLEQLSVNRLTEDNEDFSATPAISGGQLFIRSDRHLYCIAEQDN
ncbi:MAG: PQQ-like beta-propeller repeat protein [Planctomycetes bacterium]|nr:PQQ-like beta-propeller repeat protein [Planctomycetota bacterium]MCH9727500.1 PQQ-like beta-propeller repeat protein [Planctomycetota bacterium]MCH9777518.1 PQQ-like beta-propeller repeat protein [Planctomycetota bacterium]MCH9790313.1 PQQ-like beta-propeller repeat protein [Planctomycetota bacterium]MDF1743348.1 PQQ-binding-like beta-propeller repeat protein [Gimesia sp.]